MFDFMNLSAVELVKLIRKKDVSATEVTKQTFEYIDRYNSDLNAFITLNREDAWVQARKIDEGIVKGDINGALVGVPIAIKDNIVTDGLRTTCGSFMLDNFIPNYDADVVKALKEAGAIIIGKTNMDEFAMGSTTETSYYGVSLNPYDKSRVPGGSSGGSAVAVASKFSFCALGSDTGGSIRQPGAFCNLVGIKPTYGLVSRNGLVAYASTYDQIGPMARTVEDASVLLDVISGYSKYDSTNLGKNSTYRSYNNILKGEMDSLKKKSLDGIKIAIPLDYITHNLDEEIKNSIHKVASELSNRGAIVEEIKLKYTDYVVPTYYTIASAQASSNLARYDGVRYGYKSDEYDELHNMYVKNRTKGFGREVKRRIMLGTYVLSAGFYEEHYIKAQKVARLIKQEYDSVFEKYDIVLGPVTESIAPKLGESLNKPLDMYSKDIYTVIANLIGIPAMSIPVGFGKENMPIGVQLMANYMEDDKMIYVGKLIEQIIKNL